MSQPSDLAGWLAYLESRNRDSIVLGLERVADVAKRLGLQPAFPVITVGGTNGKGSVCAYLEAMLGAAGMKVGCYTSPHLLRYNERIRIDGVEARDEDLCEAFARVEAARGDTPLTYFEQGTLAAFWLFLQAKLDVVVLEVGLGGRLDAVNLWDADCAVVTCVDLDHQAFLGDTREAIGFEKAGICRPGRPCIYGEAQPPASLVDHARGIGAQLLRFGSEFQVREEGTTWSLAMGDTHYPALPRPAMAGGHQIANAACAVAALHALRNQLPVARQALRGGLVSARQPGRFQIVGREPLRVLDVAHNPHAARSLAASLRSLLAQRGPGGRLISVLALLADKDARGVIEPLVSLVNSWHVAGLDVPRGLSASSLAHVLSGMGVGHQAHDSVRDAWHAACREATAADTICAFGSFYTVAELLTDTDAVPPTHG